MSGKSRLLREISCRCLERPTWVVIEPRWHSRTAVQPHTFLLRLPELVEAAGGAYAD